MSDYLAVIFLPAGCEWGRSPKKEEAIKTAIKRLKFYRQYYKISNIKVKISIVDVSGHNEVDWDALGNWFADGKKFTPKFEVIERTTPKWK